MRQTNCRLKLVSKMGNHIGGYCLMIYDYVSVDNQNGNDDSKISYWKYISILSL